MSASGTFTPAYNPRGSGISDNVHTPDDVIRNLSWEAGSPRTYQCLSVVVLPCELKPLLSLSLSLCLGLVGLTEHSILEPSQHPLI
jgi:hypothetical protein